MPQRHLSDRDYSVADEVAMVTSQRQPDGETGSATQHKKRGRPRKRNDDLKDDEKYEVFHLSPL